MQIPLINGGFTEVDEQDESLARAFRWRRVDDKRSEGRTSYAGMVKRIAGKSVGLFLHRLIMQAKPGEKVDHRDGNGLNNQRDNLRLCTHSQNKANGRQWKTPKSGYRGVYAQEGGRWFAAISNGSHAIRSLGSFLTKEEAARAYDKAARERWGEFCRPNFPEMLSVTVMSTVTY